MPAERPPGTILPISGRNVPAWCPPALATVLASENPNVSISDESLTVTRPRMPRWRSVGNTHTTFATESFIDELAHAARRDPLEYRRALLAKAGAKRHLGVLNRAVALFGDSRPLPAGHARGIAVHASFGSYVAQVAEVSLVDGKPRVHRVACAVDCGIAVNPETIRAQMEGAIAFGLTAALYGAITLKDGRVQQDNFDTYPVLRMDAMPSIEVAVIDSGEKPGGIGEPGTPPIAPAVANALFALTGKRLRDLPFKLA